MNAWDISFQLRYIILLLLIVMVDGCGVSLCSNDLISESNSPDGKYVATIFERNCGATTPYVQVISLRLTNTTLNYEKYDDWIFTIHGKSKIDLYWESAYKLKVSYTYTGDHPTQRINWRDVAISYK